MSESFLQRYAMSPPAGRAHERLFFWLARIDAHGMRADRTTVDTWLNGLLRSNARLDLFYLEGLLKLYRKAQPELRAAYDEVKGLEDALGRWSAARGFVALAREVALSIEAVAVLEAEEHRALAALRTLCSSAGWWNADGVIPCFARWVAQWASLDLGSDQEDRKYVKKRILKALAAFDEQRFDLNLLQGDTGVHELRRKLRWIAIYLTAADGLFVLGDHHPVSSYRALLSDPVAHSPYAQLPRSTRERKPYVISRTLYLALTRAIDALGALKDRGERVEALRDAWVRSGVPLDPHGAEEAACALLRVPSDEMRQVSAGAHRIYRELADHGWAQAMRADIRGG